MKPIKVIEGNRDRINAAISESEGRATVRRICFDDIVSALAQYERELGIPKTSMTGIELDLDINAQTFPGAYKYTPDSTHARVVRTASGWALTHVTRDTCRGPTRRVEVLSMPGPAVRALLIRVQAYDFIRVADAAHLFDAV